MACSHSPFLATVENARCYRGKISMKRQATPKRQANENVPMSRFLIPIAVKEYEDKAKGALERMAKLKAERLAREM